MAIKVTICGEQEIKLTENKNNQGIKSVEFIFDSEDSTKDRSIDAIVGLKISGEISELDKKETLELGKWALCTEGKGIYRKVNVIITNEEENILREYNFSSMFVVDYTEKFELTGGTYTLILRQRPKDINIEIFA